VFEVTALVWGQGLGEEQCTAQEQLTFLSHFRGTSCAPGRLEPG
jgi:hypothetical protein